MPIVTTQVDNEEVELEVSPSEIELTEDDDPTDLPGVQEEINRVAGKTRKNAKQTAKKTLKSDEEAFREVAEAHGYEFRRGRTDQRLSRQRQGQGAEEGECSAEAEGREGMQQARDTRLENQLLQHADDVKEDMKDLYLSDAKSRFTYDADDDDFYPVGEDGNPQYASSTEDVIDNLREERPSMFKDRSANPGPDEDPNPDADDTETVTQSEYMSKAETMSEQEFSEWSQNVEIE